MPKEMSGMKQVLILNILSSFIFYSCASNGFLMAKARVNLYQEAYPAKEENAQIDIYRTQTPDEKYIEIGEITCADTNDEYALKQVLIKAREIGADAIIILGKANSSGVGVPVGNMVYASSYSYGIKAVAIKYSTD